MSDAVLIREAAALGLDERSARALPLLPLLHFAWSDGPPTPAEVAAVRGLLRGRYELNGAGLERAERWLAAAPLPAELGRGRSLVIALVRRQKGKWTAPQTREELAEVSRTVLRGVSSVFGLRRLARHEEDALGELVAVLGPRLTQPWPDVAGLLAAVPTTGDEDDDLDPPTDIGRPLPPRPSTAPPSVVPERRADALTLTRLDARLSTSVARGAELTVGRTRGNSFQILDDGEVSRHHCRLFDRDGVWFVEDLGSMNGTRVDGELISQRQLAGGEEVLIGNSLYRVALA